MGAISFQTIKWIATRPPIIFCKPPIIFCKQDLTQCLVMLSSVFLVISIFVTTNNLINKTNSRSFFLWLLSQIENFKSSLSTGRTNPYRMIPYCATHGSRKRLNNKLIQEEYKIWVLVAESCGLLVQFRQVQRKGNRLTPLLNRDSEKTLSFDLFMHNYFTCFCLLTHLGVNNIWATGVFNKNRLRKCTITGNKQLQKIWTLVLWPAHIKQKSSVTLIRMTTGQFT